MEIVLKNGEKIKLDWNSIVFEYLEDYEGGIEQLYKDMKKNMNFKLINFLIYCFVAAAYPKEIGYREAISLVNPIDLDKIVDYMTDNMFSYVTKYLANNQTQEETTKPKHRI